MLKNKLMDYTDEIQLLDQLRDADEQAFAHVFHQYYKRVCLFALSFTADDKEAEDVARDAFVRVWNSPKDFKSVAHLRSVLYLAARQVGVNYQTARNRSKHRDQVYAAEQDTVQESQLQQIIYAEAMSELYTAIQELPEQARKVITATYLEGKSNQEAADELNLSLQTIKNHKLRALSILRQRLDHRAFELLITGYFIIQDL